MSYTAKRIILLLMAWGLLVFVGVTVRINLTTPPLPLPTPTAAAPVVGDSSAAPLPTGRPSAERAAQLQQILEKDPNNVAALVELAGITYEEHDWDSTVTLYQRALVLDPHNVDVLVHLAAAELYALQFADARDTLKQASDLAPDRADIHLLLGLALSHTTPPDPAGAKQEWQKVIALAPNTALAQQAQDLLNGGTGPTQ